MVAPIRGGFRAKPTKYLLCSALNMCANMLNIRSGSQIHAHIVQNGHSGDNVILNSALVDLYAKCGRLVYARRVFDAMRHHDHVSWTTMICGYAQNGDGIESLLLFKKMLVESCVRPNCFTYVGVVSACGGLEASVVQCRLVHGHVVHLGMDGNSFVVSALIDCYSKSGNVDEAFRMFDAMESKDVVVYNSMISGCAQSFRCYEALGLFMGMRREDLGVSGHSLSSILKACGGLVLLGNGRQMHSLLIKVGSVSNVFVVSALIDMYSNCGRVDEARHVFDQTVRRNSVLWTSMVAGYAKSGRGLEGLELFDRLVMEEELVMDHVCFMVILSACNHAGFLEKGVEYFEKMTKDYGLMPKLDHYACLVDLYARKGHLVEARQIMEDMPFAPNDVMLSSFLGFCKTYREVELASKTFDQLVRMRPYNAAAYLLMIQIYVEAGLWDEAAAIRKVVKQHQMRKNGGWSWIEVDEADEVVSASSTSLTQRFQFLGHKCA